MYGVIHDTATITAGGRQSIYKYPIMHALQTDKLIILHFRRGAGGKFLANCLGFSSKFVLQDLVLAKKQLNNELSSSQKFDLIINRLDNLIFWNDLDLGDLEYFQKSLPNIISESQLNSVCKEVCNQNLFFAGCFHTIQEVSDTVKNWPNAKIIHFANDQKFLTTYRKTYLRPSLEYWNIIKGPQWPLTPPNDTKEIYELPILVQHELKDLFKNEIYNHVELTLDDFGSFIEQDNLILEWNCDWYFDVESTIKSIEKIYKLLGLDDFNPDWIHTYWSKWIKKLHLAPPDPRSFQNINV